MAFYFKVIIVNINFTNELTFSNVTQNINICITNNINKILVAL